MSTCTTLTRYRGNGSTSSLYLDVEPYLKNKVVSRGLMMTIGRFLVLFFHTTDMVTHSSPTSEVIGVNLKLHLNVGVPPHD